MYFFKFHLRLFVDGQLFFNNLTRARIQGVDINTTTSIIPQHLTMNLGYNYLWAIDVDKNISLKYRPKQNAILGLNYNHNIFETGIDFRYMSRVEKIDNELVDLGLVPDGNERVDIIVLDARLGVNLFSQNIPGRIFLNVTNLFNYYYVELIGNIAPIRNFSLSAEFIF